MKERPIPFSAPMVRAILAGKKTQTRRVVKYNPTCGEPDNWCGRTDLVEKICGNVERFCPYGVPGDRLWVKETFQWLHFTTDLETGLVDGCVYPTSNIADIHSGYYIPVYEADGAFDIPKEDRGFPWKPSIFMPRWASRITLEIVSVRVERLQEISRVDAMSEGIGHMYGYERTEPAHDAVARFAELWDSINGKTPGKRWNDNPWVWVIEFRRIEPI